MDDSPSPIAGWKDSPDPAPFPRVDAPPGSGRVSVSVPADSDGHPDWARASEKVKERFKKLFEDAATQEIFGKPAGAEGGLDPEQARMLGMMALGALFQIQGLAAALKFKLTKEEIQQCFAPNFQPYPDFDKALARVLMKRGPEWLAAWADELYVGMVLTLVSLAGWSRAGNIAGEKKKQALEHDNPNSQPRIKFEIETPMTSPGQA